MAKQSAPNLNEQEWSCGHQRGGDDIDRCEECYPFHRSLGLTERAGTVEPILCSDATCEQCYPEDSTACDDAECECHRMLSE